MQVAQDMPPLPRYVVTVSSDDDGNGSDGTGSAATPADFEAIAATFGPYLHFPDRCAAAVAKGDPAEAADTKDVTEDGDSLADVCAFAAPLVLAEPSQACGGALADAEKASAAVVAVDRGGCTFVEKARACAKLQLAERRRRLAE